MSGKKKSKGRRLPPPGRGTSRRSKHGAPSKRALLVVVSLAGGIAAVVALFLWPSFSFPEFSAERAYQRLETVVGFGPRVPGSDAHRQTADWLVTQLEPLADQVTRQAVSHPIDGDTMVGTNIIASFNLQPDRNKRVMLSAHWDSRPWADNDPDSTVHDQPISGADDGGSGVAILLEMAEILASNPLDIGVDLLFFDLEDSGRDSTVAYAIGSAFFVANNPQYRPTFGINFDMVCGQDLEIPKEGNSVRAARWVVDLIWEAADEVGADIFADRIATPVFDDHIAFLQQGIPVVDLIPVPFPPYWHTLDDTLEQCSAESLQQVGDVAVRVVYSQ